MAYVFCNQCGHRNPPESGFCSSCGGVLDHIDDITITIAKVDPLQDAPGPDDDVVVNLAELSTTAASLVVRNGPQAGVALTVDGAVTRLGRAEECEISLDDITVSRWHAEILRDGDSYRVRDAGSLNGTYVNSKRIDETSLNQGDELQVGKFRMVFFQKATVERVGDRPYLSIGEVLGMLLEEFPDVSISKIRFLESQGLIDPERTPSGYRKFYDADVDRLRVILREQRQNFLPLRVIRDRLESGQIDDSGPMTPPRGLRNVTVIEGGNPDGVDETGDLVVAAGTVVPTAHHPAAQARAVSAPATATMAAAPAPPVARPAPPAPPTPTLSPTNGRAAQPVAERHETLLSNELCARAGITSAQLADLVSYGVVVGTGAGANALFSSNDVAIAAAAAGFLVRGVEARHLRQWRRAAEQEAALFEQLILPVLRQRSAHNKQLAANSIRELSALGSDLRAAILAAALRQHLEP